MEYLSNFDELLLQMEEDLNNTEENEQNIIIEETAKKHDLTDIIKQEYLQTINQECCKNHFTPTNPRISIITVCASINTKATQQKQKDFINKNALLEHCCPQCMGIYQKLEGHTCEIVKRKKSKKIGGFYNQKTLLIPISGNRKKNFKIFWNGKVQLTGLKSEEDGYETIRNFISIVSEIDIQRKQQNLPLIIKEYDNLQLNNFRICLINSDFSVGFKIKRNILYELLKQKYGISVSYEPDYYQGVKTKFYWNRQNIHNGICNCTKKCNGKGKGMGDGDCKRVTIAIFQSGNINISAQSFQQIKDSYLFINTILSNEYSLVKREEIKIKKTDELIQQSPKIYIEKQKITNLEIYKTLLN